MTAKNPDPPAFTALSPVKKAAALRSARLIEDARLKTVLAQEAARVALLTDSQAAAELGIKLDGSDTVLQAAQAVKEG